MHITTLPTAFAYTALLVRAIVDGSSSINTAQVYTPSDDLNRLARLMPRSPLPAPSGQLKYVVLGLGTQNYTCTSGNEGDVPGTTGAVATLYDIGSRLNSDIAAAWKIPAISCLALSLSSQPKALKRSLELEGYHHVLGHHFFNKVNGTNTPVFAFDQLSQTPHPTAQVTKINETDAPESLCTGIRDPVQWLYLADVRGISYGGVHTVYRIETAGGKAPMTCKGQKTNFVVSYAAQYWVFGP